MARDGMLAIAVAGALLAFFAADALLLQELPRRRLSFGPWQGQIAALALPRAAVALVSASPVCGSAGRRRCCCSSPRRSSARWPSIAERWLKPGQLGLSRLAIRSNRLPPSAPPIRILHAGDIHLEPADVREAQLLELAETTQPDLILLTGDYVNLSNNVDPETHAQVRRLLGQLHARYGVFAVLGTPQVSISTWPSRLFDGLPARLLRDEAVAVTLAAAAA